MALSNAERQARWRAKREARLRASAEAIEAVLLADVRRAERGELSDVARIALAAKLADAAMDNFRRMHRLNKLAQKVRTGG